MGNIRRCHSCWTTPQIYHPNSKNNNQRPTVSKTLVSSIAGLQTGSTFFCWSLRLVGFEWQHTFGRKLAISIKQVVMERVVLHANSIACTVASDPEVMWHITASAMQLATLLFNGIVLLVAWETRCWEHTHFVVRMVPTKPSLRWPQQTGIQCWPGAIV